MRNKFILLLLLSLPVQVFADAMLVKKQSPYSVNETMDKLEAIISKKGLSVFVRIDHGKNAQSVDMKMNEAQLLVFGDPKGGTKLMQADPAVALELPLKVVVYADNNKQTWVSYRSPEQLKTDYAIGESPVIPKVTEALDKLTSAAIK